MDNKNGLWFKKRGYCDATLISHRYKETIISGVSVYLHKNESHEEVRRGPEEELRSWEDMNGGVVDGGVEGEAHHGHDAVQGSHHGRYLSWDTQMKSSYLWYILNAMILNTSL